MMIGRVIHTKPPCADHHRCYCHLRLRLCHAPIASGILIELLATMQCIWQHIRKQAVTLLATLQDADTNPPDLDRLPAELLYPCDTELPPLKGACSTNSKVASV